MGSRQAPRQNEAPKNREKGAWDALGSALDAMLAHRRVSPRALCDRYAPGRHGEVFHSPGSVPGGVRSFALLRCAPAVSALRCSPVGF